METHPANKTGRDEDPDDEQYQRADPETSDHRITIEPEGEHVDDDVILFTNLGLVLGCWLEMTRR